MTKYSRDYLRYTINDISPEVENIGDYLSLNKIKAIIFDFDGVILESTQIKTKAFEMLFSQYPLQLDKIIAFHRDNMGISRYVKFRHIYNEILGQELNEVEEKRLGEKFSQIVLEQILKAPFVPGTREFMDEWQSQYEFFIASGTPQQEMEYILTQLNLDQFFCEIYGSPQHKPDIIKQIMTGHSLEAKQVVFIGDARSDLLAAKEMKVNFIARITDENRTDLAECKWQIEDLSELAEVLENISGCGGNEVI